MIHGTWYDIQKILQNIFHFPLFEGPKNLYFDHEDGSREKYSHSKI